LHLKQGISSRSSTITSSQLHSMSHPNL